MSGLEHERQAGDHHGHLRAGGRDALIEPAEFIDVKARHRSHRHDT